MTREDLAAASDQLELAGERASGDAAGRLDDLADQLDTLATRDRAPDHGRLARIENALTEVRESVDDDVVDAIADAEMHITAFRETIEGV